MYSLSGGTIKKSFTEICDQKFFLVYDMPHLIKSLRNNLLNGDIQIGDKIISLDDVKKKTFDIDSNSSTAREMCKLTPAHLAPNAFQKMSCKLAVQVLSNTVAKTKKRRSASRTRARRVPYHEWKKIYVWWSCITTLS